jgi:hypothetical protein
MAQNLKNNYLCRVEDQLLRDVRGQAGEGNGKDMSPGSSVSTIETKVNCKRNNSQFK